MVADVGKDDDARASGWAVGERAAPDGWWTVAIVSILYVFSYLDRFVLTMLVPDVKASLHLSDFQLGLVLGPAFALFFAVFGIPLGWAADHYSRRWVILLGTLLFGAATGVSGLATSFAALLVARVCVGIGEASLTPAAMSLMAAKIPKRGLNTAVSIFSMGPKIGSAAAYAFGGLALVAAASLRQEWQWLHQVEPWRLTLAVVAAPSVLVALLLLTVTEPARPPYGEGAEAVSGAQGALAFMISERELMVPLLIGFGAMTICGQSLISWVPTFINRQFAWSPAVYGPLLGAISLAGGLTLVFKGLLMDWLYVRGFKDIQIRFYTWLLVATLPLALAVFLLRDGTWFIIIYALVAVVTIPYIAYISAAVQMVTPPALRGRVFAIVSLPLAILGGLGPLLVGAITDFLFRDEARLGSSLAIMMVVTIPVALVCMRISLPPLRRAVERAEERG
jgi:MFS family permease